MSQLHSDFVKNLMLWVSRPGLIRTLKLTFSTQGFLVELEEADSQPEYYQSTHIRANATHKDLLECFKLAAIRLENIAEGERL